MLTRRLYCRCFDFRRSSPSFLLSQVNLELRRLADKKGPDEEEFSKLANSVDEFTNCLLEPLKSNTEARHAFGDSLDDIIEAGIELEQKKVAYSSFLSYFLVFFFWRYVGGKI